MFGSHFYHATVRKSVAVFGTIFNNITVARKKGDGSLVNQVKVPLAYGPKQKFLSRLDSETGQDASVAMKLPRMAFEITGVDFDTSKKLQRRSSIDEPTSTTVGASEVVSTDFTKILPLNQTTPAQPAIFAQSQQPYLGRTFANQKYINPVLNLRNIDGSAGVDFNGEKVYTIRIDPMHQYAPWPQDPTTIPGSKITAYQAESRYVIKLFVPTNVTGVHPTTENGLRDTLTGLQLFDTPSTGLGNDGTQQAVLLLRVADAFAVDTTAFMFSQPTTVYYWEITQATMNRWYDIALVQQSAMTPVSWGTFPVTTTASITSRKSIKQQAPYNINMQLNIMAKNQDDGLQILEQIIPYFQPEYTVAIKPIDDMTSFKQDVPIILNDVSFDDQYEGDYNSRRVLIYTLDFTMKMSFYGPLTAPGIIRQVLINFTEERIFGTVITSATPISYPTFFVPGATIYQGSDRSRTWSGTIESITSTTIRLVESNTTGYVVGSPIYVNSNNVIQEINIVGDISLTADINTISSMDIKVGTTDTESDFTVTTTIDNSDFS